MFKHIRWIAFFFLAMAITLVLASCKEEVKNHVCGEWTVVKEPTCSEKGLRTRVCSVCGEEEFEDISIVAHVYNEIRHCVWCGRMEATESLRFTLSRDGKSYVVSGYNGSKADLVLPCEYNGLPVSAIAESAFAKNTNIVTIYIHSSMTEIGKDAFASCISLTSVNLPESIKKIDEGAFSGCEKLVEVINHTSLDIKAGSDLHGGVAKNARFVHESNISKIKNTDDFLSFEDGDTYLLGYVGNEKNIVLPESIDGKSYSIYKYAFAYSGISSLEITKGASHVEKFAFNYCSSLERVSVTAENISFEESVFESCMFLKEAAFAGGIKNLGTSMFRNCASLARVTLPKALEKVPESVFRACDALESVALGAAVKAVEDYAFYGCSSLSSVAFENGAETIGMYAFSGCNSLSVLKLPATVKEIGDFGFYSCKELQSVTMPSELERIGNYAFKDCTSLRSMSYDKTMLKWGGIVKGAEWNTNTAGISVICSDGLM